MIGSKPLYTIMWYMNDIEFTDAPDDIEGFVYVITDKRNDKKYVGKKRFW